ncbi:MAG: BolA family transcriptional regulator [Gemmobacter sp.]|nr:BolA family transcriptional regulator [Gemmobacter sp.]
MSVKDEIHARLTAAFAPDVLDIQDDSEKHRGHGGWREGGETHFTVMIRAPGLASLSRLERHRAVHRALGEMTARIHALALDIG